MSSRKLSKTSGDIKYLFLSYTYGVASDVEITSHIKFDNPLVN